MPHVFDDRPRTDRSVARRAEPTFAFLDRAPGAFWQRVRDELERWIDAYPGEHRTALIRRIKSSRPKEHRGAWWELYVHALFLALGARVAVIVDPTQRRPDFLVTMAEQQFYVEATTTTGGFGESPAEDRLIDIIDEIPPPPKLGVWVTVVRDGSPGDEPRKTEIHEPIRAWLADLGDPAAWPAQRSAPFYLRAREWMIELTALHMPNRVALSPDTRLIVAGPAKVGYASDSRALKSRGGRECVRALTYEQVAEIVDGFRRLNPYNRRVVPGSILEVDDASLDASGEVRGLWAWSIAAKRYATFTRQDGRPALAEKYSEHGLGHISDPRSFDHRERPLAADIWQHILDAELGSVSEELGWFDVPTVTQRTISTPRVHRLLGGRRHADSELRPFSFCNHAILHPDAPQAHDRVRFDLVAPYEREPDRWAMTEWTDAEAGATHRITTSTTSGQDAVRVKGIRDMVALYRRKREAKSLAPDGPVCTRGTAGLLRRRPVRDLTIRHIGKESNEIEDVQRGVASADAATAVYRNLDRSEYQHLVLPILRAFTVAQLTRATGLPRRTLQGLRSGRSPTQATITDLLPGLAQLCRSSMPAAAIGGALVALAACKHLRTSPSCPTCGAPTSRRRTYCRSACRQRAFRLRRG